ncbi:MAG: LytTR family DNA-binding domain-containing protein [Pseudomonadota bacterium]
MTGLSVLVVDDEPLARRRVIRLLTQLDWVARIDEAGDVDSACALLDGHAFHILLLDVQMPGGGGFEVLERTTRTPPGVIFVTAFDHHALRAFEVSAVDYLAKPIDPGRFHAAMLRAKNAVAAVSQADRIAELQETVTTLRTALGDRDKSLTEFWVKARGGYVRVPTEAIVRLQSERDYVRICTSDASYLYHESMASLERRLDPAAFLRIHRSTIVRRSAIVRVRQAPFAALVAVLTDGSDVRVGRTYTPMVRNSLLRSG